MIHGDNIMTELRLISTGRRPLKKIVEAALNNEMKLMETGIKRTKHRLKRFEDQYHMNTEDFISEYENDKFQESMDFIEWIGEFRLLKRLNDKLETLN